MAYTPTPKAPFIWVPKTLTFKIRPSVQPFLWKLVLFTWENKKLFPHPPGDKKEVAYKYVKNVLKWVTITHHVEQE